MPLMCQSKEESWISKTDLFPKDTRVHLHTSCFTFLLEWPIRLCILNLKSQFLIPVSKNIFPFSDFLTYINGASE